MNAPAAMELARLFGAVRTERLTLRRLRAGDVESVFAVHGDPETNHHNPAGPHPDRAASEALLESWLRRWQEDGYGYWGVSVAPGSAIVGFGGVQRITWRDRDVLNLYYRFTPSTWGRGYATELALAAVGLARAHLSELPVIARTRPGNLASLRTAERAGLVRRPDLDLDGHVVLAIGWGAPGQAPLRGAVPEG